MNCNIIKDLIPLYIDGCCSGESEKAVEAHVRECRECRQLLEEMKIPSDMVAVSEAPKTFSKLNDWKASVLQSVLLFLSFALIAIAVALEAATPAGPKNGFWAVNLIIPATGFMLSLANWYFIRIYKSRKHFSNYSLVATFVITFCAYLWSVFHYKANLSNLFNGNGFTENIDSLFRFSGIGILLTAVFSALSKILSVQYARMLGKE